MPPPDQWMTPSFVLLALQATLRVLRMLSGHDAGVGLAGEPVSQKMSMNGSIVPARSVDRRRRRRVGSTSCQSRDRRHGDGDIGSRGCEHSGLGHPPHRHERWFDDVRVLATYRDRCQMPRSASAESAAPLRRASFVTRPVHGRGPWRRWQDQTRRCRRTIERCRCRGPPSTRRLVPRHAG